MLDEPTAQLPIRRFVPLAVFLVVLCAIALWRWARWRQHVRQEYARVQLYEDRPFAYGGESTIMDSPACLHGSLGTEAAMPVAASGCQWGGATRLTMATLDEDVTETQRLIKDALNDSTSGQHTQH